MNGGQSATQKAPHEWHPHSAEELARNQVAGAPHHALTRGVPPSLLHRRAPDRWSGEAVGEADVHDALQERNHSTDKIWERELCFDGLIEMHAACYHFHH